RGMDIEGKQGAGHRPVGQIAALLLGFQRGDLPAAHGDVAGEFVLDRIGIRDRSYRSFPCRVAEDLGVASRLRQRRGKGLRAHSPSPGWELKYFSNLSGVPSKSLASAGGSFLA